jgi:hypothetical protein
MRLAIHCCAACSLLSTKPTPRHSRSVRTVASGAATTALVRDRGVHAGAAATSFRGADGVLGSRCAGGRRSAGRKLNDGHQQSRPDNDPGDGECVHLPLPALRTACLVWHCGCSSGRERRKPNVVPRSERPRRFSTPPTSRAHFWAAPWWRRSAPLPHCRRCHAGERVDHCCSAPHDSSSDRLMADANAGSAGRFRGWRREGRRRGSCSCWPPGGRTIRERIL